MSEGEGKPQEKEAGSEAGADLHPKGREAGGEVQISPEEGMLPTETAAEFFRALSDENRIKILNLLARRELCATELLQSLDIVQSTMSHHMKVLCEAGIVNCEKRGKRSCYSIRKEAVADITGYLNQWQKGR